MHDINVFLMATVGSNVLIALIAFMLVANLLIAAVALMKYGNSRHLPKSPYMAALCAKLLSANVQQREFILRHLIGLSSCLAGLLALNFGVARGVIDIVGGAWLTYSALIVIAAVTLMLRSGLNRRFSDPALVTAHIVFAELYFAWGYYLGGPCRHVGMLLLFAVLLANFFTSSTKVVIATSLVAIVAFGAVMARLAWLERAIPNGPQIQLVNFGALLIVLISLYLLVHHLTRIRSKSTQRKKELLLALAHIEKLAIRDELTGLFNRRHIQELLDAEKSRCERTSRNFCLGMVDVDNFKSINDTYGHGVGDQVLVAMAAILLQGMRDVDLVARWGGEEFLIIFPDTGDEMAAAVLRRVLKTLSDAAVCQTVPELRVSFSAGVTQFALGEVLSRTVDRADAALYQAKSAGRNRVTLAAKGPSDRNMPP